MFTIAPPFTGDQTGTADDPSSENTGGAIGQCTMDTFQVTGSGGASPVICGANDGQHMIVDTDGAACVTAAFSFGLDTTTRNYRIHAIQYDRLNEMGGPAGCLQFFTGMEGTVTTFGWATTTTSTHLANQDYDVCIRRLADRCSICWSPTGIAGAAILRGAFGLSNGPSDDAAPLPGVGTDCAAIATVGAEDSNDYVIIPNGQTAAAAAAAAVTAGSDKICGRFFSTNNAAAGDTTICSRVTPFKISVFTDGAEAVGTLAADAAAEMAKNNEASAGSDAANATPVLSPLGTMGFSLGFAQIAC